MIKRKVHIRAIIHGNDQWQSFQAKMSEILGGNQKPLEDREDEVLTDEKNAVHIVFLTDLPVIDITDIVEESLAEFVMVFCPNEEARAGNIRKRWRQRGRAKQAR